MLAAILMFTLVVDLWLDYWIRTNRAQLSKRASKLFLAKLYSIIAGFIVIVSALWISPFQHWEPFWRTYAIGALIIFVCVKISVGGIFFLQFLLSKFSKNNKLISPKKWFQISICTAVLVFGITLYGSIYEVFNLRVKHVEIKDKSVPKAFDGYKIVQFSDMHIGSQVSNHYVKKLVDLINAQIPDLVVFTGDMLNLNTDEIVPFVSLFSEIRAKDGVYVVLGNHDYGGYLNWKYPKDSLKNVQQLRNIYQSLNWRVMQNEHVYLYRGQDSIVLAGVDNYSSKKSKRRNSFADTEKALQGTSTKDFIVMLSHNPQHFGEELTIDYPNVNLTLSGHSHGGQMAIGKENLQFSPSQLSLPHWGGFYHVGNQYLFVNTGCGFNVFPFRINMPPNISVITLYW
jgi:predicted MPP superfamily phosphohydrolase